MPGKSAPCHAARKANNALTPWRRDGLRRTSASWLLSAVAASSGADLGSVALGCTDLATALRLGCCVHLEQRPHWHQPCSKPAIGDSMYQAILGLVNHGCRDARLNLLQRKLPKCIVMAAAKDKTAALPHKVLAIARGGFGRFALLLQSKCERAGEQCLCALLEQLACLGRHTVAFSSLACAKIAGIMWQIWNVRYEPGLTRA
mmetsp:Transcript_28013/g.55058  ORF Transcript_28013/g.55058 Transcript_28013/m.55058 type:complete len:203 (-) Transcript_28013:3-611(-)